MAIPFLVVGLAAAGGAWLVGDAIKRAGEGLDNTSQAVGRAALLAGGATVAYLVVMGRQ